MNTQVPDPTESFPKSSALAERLAAHGVTPTPQRLRIAAALLSHPQHLSAEQILATVSQTGAPVSKATVYNTLKLFCEQGLAREVNVDPERVFYDSMTGSHHHFYNVDTGELTDIAPGQLDFARLPELPPDTETESIEVIMRVRRRSQP